MGNSLKVKRSVDNPSYTFDFIQCRTRFLSQVIAYKTDISIYLSSFFLFKVYILLKCRKFLQRQKYEMSSIGSRKKIMMMEVQWSRGVLSLSSGRSCSRLQVQTGRPELVNCSVLRAVQDQVQHRTQYRTGPCHSTTSSTGPSTELRPVPVVLRLLSALT